MNIGIMGCGGIAGVMADVINKTGYATLYAVSSRTLEKAIDFKNKYGAIKAYGSYKELAEDNNIDLIYIATPHSEHYSNMKLVIENRKNVLCEKAFTINKNEALEIRDLAKKYDVYVSEALWPRYFKIRNEIENIINSGLIGDIDILTANLCYKISDVERIKDINLAGGALLDIGVYGLNFMIMCFGYDIESIDTVVKKMESGVDGKEVIIVNYKDSKTAILTHSVYSISDARGIVYGSKGYFVVNNINNPTKVDVYDNNGKIIKTATYPHKVHGFEHELKESIEQIKKGLKESYSMPLSESIKLLEIMDTIREKWNFKYPKELTK